MKKIILFILIFFAYTGTYCANLSIDSSFSLKISCKELAGKELFLSYQYDEKYLNVSPSNKGEAEVRIPINHAQFLSVAEDGMNDRIIILAQNGYNLKLNYNKGNYFFTGKGATINNYLLQKRGLFSVFNDSVGVLDNTIQDVNRFMKWTEKLKVDNEKLLRLYKDSVQFNTTLLELLKKNLQASILNVKHEFINYFLIQGADSFNLQDKLNLTESNLLLEDTLLLNHYSIDFASYIWNARNTFLMRTVKWTDNYELFIKNINEVLQQTSTFGLKAKQYVFFYWLMFDMKIKGTNLFLDTTANALKRDNWISKKYHDVFLKERQTYEHLFHGKPAPHLQGINTEEKVVSLNDLKGKVVFVDVWATWCAPCIEALPHVQELQEKFKNNKDVIFLFLSNDSREDGDKQWKNYLKEHPEFKGIHVRAREKEDRKFEGGWKVTGIPRYLLIDKQGNIIDAFARNNSYEKLAEMIEEASRK